MTDRADSEHSMNLARRWFTEGGEKCRAGRRPIQRERQNQWVLVGEAGPKRRIQERLAGFPVSPQPSRMCSQLTIRS
jgi:hypothetical protein